MSGHATTCPRCGAPTTEEQLTYSGCPLCQRETASADTAPIESYADRHRGFGTNVKPRRAP